MADVADFDRLIARLEELADKADDLAEEIRTASIEFPFAPGQVGNSMRLAGEVAAGLRRGISRSGELQQRAEAAATRRERTAEERKYDAHTKAMAERMGITPDEFLELQEKRRREMRGAPGTMSYAPDHEVVR